MFYIRADASAQIGIGHVKRCIAIGEQIVSRGIPVKFLSRFLSETAKQSIIDAKMSYQIFASLPLSEETEEPNFHSKWLQTTQDEDAKQTILAAKTESCKGLLVDNYALSAKWEKEVSSKLGIPIFAIDDLCDRPHSIQVLIDYNCYGNDKGYRSLVNSEANILLGPAYSPIRREFLTISENTRSKDRTQVPSHILVFLGGGDPQGVTRTVLQGLIKSSVTQKVTVIFSKQNEHYQQIATLCEKIGATLLEPLPNLAELLQTVDISLSAGGVAQIERSFLGIPSLIVSIAENQNHISENLHKMKACIYLGKSSDVTPEHWHTSLQELLNSPKKRLEISQGGMSLIDGNGVTRILQHFAL